MPTLNALRTARAEVPASSPLSQSKSAGASPFVKWAGGKTQLLPELRKYIPAHFGTYIEPFAGGAALFFELLPTRSVLNDTNEELMNAFRIVQSDVESLISLLSTYPYDTDFFYAQRTVDTATLSPLENAARFLYLNKCCFNGLYRVNKKGAFNVPFGRYTNLLVCDAPKLRRASDALQHAILESKPYEEVLSAYAKAGDFVYIDPPYAPVSKYSDFTRYTKDPFKEKDQERLRNCIVELKARGVYVIASNSVSALTLELYRGFDLKLVEARRSINARAGGRSALKEVIIL